MVLCCDGRCRKSNECANRLCNGECISMTEPCNNICPDSSYFLFEDVCIKKTRRLWECNGQLQSWSLSCNGTCIGGGALDQFDLSQFNIDGSVADFYWKCPNEYKCISSENLCNKNSSSSEALRQNRCELDIQNSRKVCDNPDAYEFKLNCSRRGQLQCPGNKTQQCINERNICDGEYNCVDR